MRLFSIIIPVYNRPAEVKELLESLTHQTYKHFEVIIVEDGSTNKCDDIVKEYEPQLNIRYYFKPNSGQGFSRNYGYERASGEYFIVFDSDCLIPADYLEVVNNYLNKEPLDAYGGPDRSHPDFTLVQKAISYSMTSFFTTGGIRGNKKHVGKFHPRSFNMGISKEVFEETGGYIIPFMGEDIEFSIRIIENGFSTGLINDAFVYHKRRTSLSQFFKQLHFFGRARINISRFYPKELKLVHTFPLFFVMALISWVLLVFINLKLFLAATILFAVYLLLIGIDSTIRNRNIGVGILSIAASVIQLSAYGIGFLSEGLRKLIKG